MSKTISFKCEESTVHLFVQILNKLQNAGARNQTRKIRIGGDEYVFAGCDNVVDLSIDGKLYGDLTPSEQRDFEILRHAVISPTPAPAQPATIASVPDNASTGVPDNASTGVPDNASTGIPDNATAPDTDEDDDLLDSADAIAVRNIITNKVSQSEMFTAFDITKELRTNGTFIHRNIKQIVHALYNHGEMQGYDRSLVDVGTNVRPFLYHPSSADVSTYQV